MDDNAPPRLRWRLLTWVIGALILLPVLYVAAAGPLAWWDYYHDGFRERVPFYYDSIAPLYRQHHGTPWLNQYENWWRVLSAPRSWQRRKETEYIDWLRESLTEMQRQEREREKDRAVRFTTLRDDLARLEAEPESRLGRAEELARVRAMLETLPHADPDGVNDVRHAQKTIREYLQAAEQRLRRFDAQ